MAITRLTAPSITGLTIPNTSINNASLDSVTALPGGIDVGKIGQVVNSKFTSTFSTTSTSFVTTGHSASITPTSTSSKILIFLNGGSSWNNNNVNYNRWTTIYRGATDLGAGTVGLQNMYANTFFGGPHSINYLDSPASTSSTTYTVYHRTEGGTSWYTHDAGTGTATPVNLTLMEVLA
jgi:hypothetical protein